MENILYIVLAHYICDYPLQGSFLAKTKDKYISSLWAHSVIYGLGMAMVFKLIGVFAIWKAFVLVMSHFLIDYKKGHAKNKSKSLTTYLYIDQALHLIINFILYVI